MLSNPNLFVIEKVDILHSKFGLQTYQGRVLFRVNFTFINRFDCPTIVMHDYGP